MRQVSLCLVIRESEGLITEILLAMKKRGFGQGRWNGVGGKPDQAKGENVLDSAIRETEEEVKIKPKKLEKVAIFDFYFPEHRKEHNQQVHVFLIREWEGEPEETEEMKPQWFKTEIIPYDEMWDDDKYWLPHILQGKKLKAKFFFDEQDKVSKQEINLVEALE